MYTFFSMKIEVYINLLIDVEKETWQDIKKIDLYILKSQRNTQKSYELVYEEWMGKNCIIVFCNQNFFC